MLCRYTATLVKVPLSCQPHTDCDALGKITSKNGTSTADAVCGRDKWCPCCDNGCNDGKSFCSLKECDPADLGFIGVHGTACPKDGDRTCVACPAGTYHIWPGSRSGVNREFCKPHKNCGADGFFEESPGTSTADAKCSSDRLQCLCPHGAAYTGSECNVNGSIACDDGSGYPDDRRTCDNGYFHVKEKQICQKYYN